MEAPPPEDRPHGASDLLMIALVVYFLGLIVLVGALMAAPALF